MNRESLWKEPLLHFILIGIVLFVIHSLTNTNSFNSGTTILIDDDDVNRLITQYKQVWNEDPSNTTIKKLIEEYINSEMIYNEALSMNLDHNDEIIKRRLKQKYEFLVSDLATIYEPKEEELEEFYLNNKDKFQSDKSFSFSQYYFNPDIRKNPVADAKSFLRIKTNNISNESTNTDATHLNKTFFNVSQQQIRSDFGLEFSQQLQAISTLGWHGPIQSGYGIHAIEMLTIKSDSLRNFADVKESVGTAFDEKLIDEYNKSIKQKLTENYTVNYKLDEWKELGLE